MCQRGREPASRAVLRPPGLRDHAFVAQARQVSLQSRLERGCARREWLRHQQVASGLPGEDTRDSASFAGHLRDAVTPRRLQLTWLCRRRGLLLLA